MTWTIETMRAAIGRPVRVSITRRDVCPTCEQTTGNLITEEIDARISGWAVGGLHASNDALLAEVTFGDYDLEYIPADELVFLDAVEAVTASTSPSDDLGGV